MKRLFLAVTLVMASVWAKAQTPKEEYEAWKQHQKKEYADYRQQRKDDYNAFRKKANEEYAQWLKGEWVKIKGHEADPVPEEPKPPQPIVAPDETPEPPSVVPHKEVVPVAPEKTPVPIVPAPVVPAIDEHDAIYLDYYGTSIKIHAKRSDVVHLNNTEGETLSKAWEQMSDGRYDPLLKDVLEAKKDMALSDWGFITLAKNVATKVYGKEDNSAILFEEWLLMQSGYKVRLSLTAQGTLYLLVPFSEKIFGVSYLIIDEDRYYVLGCETQESFMVLDEGFDGEQAPTLSLELPQLGMIRCKERTIASKRYPTLKMTVAENRNLISYLNDYPKIAGDWNIYARASLSKSAKEQLYPILRSKLNGKSQEQQLNMLLDWIQTGLEYEYDEKQFGGERSLFADETLYYPFCDCEDRSILLSVLVKDLVGLDVVLLHFPGHLATAVGFTENVDGDYLEIKGKKYVVCDPTYIGAPAGMAMPECKKNKVEVFLLQ